MKIVIQVRVRACECMWMRLQGQLQCPINTNSATTGFQENSILRQLSLIEKPVHACEKLWLICESDGKYLL